MIRSLLFPVVEAVHNAAPLELFELSDDSGDWNITSN